MSRLIGILVVDFLHFVPKGLLSRVWGFLARVKRPRLFVTMLKRTFVRAVGIDMSEASRSIHQYQTLEDLFVRKLRKEARVIDSDPDSVVSPVDGTIGECGIVQNNTLMQIKGKPYSLALLLDDAKEAARFEGGAYATLYLSPKDYHCIHAPVAGFIDKASVVPGRLFPVFEAAVRRIPELFARNERLVTYISAKSFGRVALVKVGATLVGRITTSYDSKICTNVGQKRKSLTYEPPHTVNKGDRLAAFEMGSTVVLIFEPNGCSLDLKIKTPVRMGERIGGLSSANI